MWARFTLSSSLCFALLSLIVYCVSTDSELEMDYALPPPRLGSRLGNIRCRINRNELPNGRIKVRSRGRITKFFCNPGYSLVGKRFATCLRGVWNNPIPICVAQGCPIRAAPSNGRQLATYRGAVLMFECDPGYTLQGSATIYCDGSRWNDSVPVCRVASWKFRPSCDFELDLCGWSQDPLHNFDWRRHHFSTPSGHASTGPSFDHTLGKGYAGYYMYIESSAPNKENDAARLFSPVYPGRASGGCFVFFYHMYGQTTGSLRIYIKKEFQVMAELRPVKEITGEQGNQWFRGTLDVPIGSENFQIVIEGIIGNGYVGDTAIDDVSLRDYSCASLESQFPLNETQGSCDLRCGDPGTQSICACNSQCEGSLSCCRDYWRVCLRGNVGNPTRLPDVEEREGNSTSTMAQFTTTETPNEDSYDDTTTLASTNTTSTPLSLTTETSFKSTTEPFESTISPSTTTPIVPTRTYLTAHTTTSNTPSYSHRTYPSAVPYTRSTAMTATPEKPTVAPLPTTKPNTVSTTQSTIVLTTTQYTVPTTLPITLATRMATPAIAGATKAPTTVGSTTRAPITVRTTTRAPAIAPTTTTRASTTLATTTTRVQTTVVGTTRVPTSTHNPTMPTVTSIVLTPFQRKPVKPYTSPAQSLGTTENANLNHFDHDGDNEYETIDSEPDLNDQYPTGVLGNPEKQIKAFPSRSASGSKTTHNLTTWAVVLSALAILVTGTAVSAYFIIRKRKRLHKRSSENSDTRFLAKSEEIQFN